MRKASILLFLSCLLLLSCRKEQWDDCFRSAGETDSTYIVLDPFTALEISDQFRIHIIQDSSRAPAMELKAPEHLLEGVRAEVDKGVLKIHNTNICNFVRKFNQIFEIKLYVKDIQKIDCYGNSYIYSSDTLFLKDLKIYQTSVNTFDLVIKANELEILTLDAGDFKFRGEVNALKGSVERVSSLDARHLKAAFVLIDTHSPLDIFVQATEVIFVKIFNAGNIFYKGAPSQKIELNERKGSGDLLPLN